MGLSLKVMGVLRPDGPLWWVCRRHPGVGRTDYDKVGRILRGFQVRHEFIRRETGGVFSVPTGGKGNPLALYEANKYETPFLVAKSREGLLNRPVTRLEEVSPMLP